MDLKSFKTFSWCIKNNTLGQHLNNWAQRLKGKNYQKSQSSLIHTFFKYLENVNDEIIVDFCVFFKTECMLIPADKLLFWIWQNYPQQGSALLSTSLGIMKPRPVSGWSDRLAFKETPSGSSPCLSGLWSSS